MAKFGRPQYLILTEAIAEHYNNVKKRDSPLLEANTLGVAEKIADYLQIDNQAFNRKQFIDGIKGTSELIDRVNNAKIDLQ